MWRDHTARCSFVVNVLFMELFCTSDANILYQCQLMFNFKTPSEELVQRKRNNWDTLCKQEVSHATSLSCTGPLNCILPCAWCSSGYFVNSMFSVFFRCLLSFRVCLSVSEFQRIYNCITNTSSLVSSVMQCIGLAALTSQQTATVVVQCRRSAASATVRDKRSV